MRPTTGNPDVGVRQRTFVARLAARRRIRLIRDALAHDVEPAAPAGVAGGLVRRKPAAQERSRLRRLWRRMWSTPEAVPAPAPEPPDTDRGPNRPRRVVVAPRTPLDARAGAPRPPKAAKRKGEPALGGPRPARSATARGPVRRSGDSTEQPPVPVRAAVERRFGVDLSKTEVRRGPKAAAAVRRAGARAFTAEEAVHVPPELGPLDRSETEPLLVHELVHVAQQRRLAPRVPAESSSEGMALEAEARTAEREARAAIDSARPRPAGAAPSERRDVARLRERAAPERGRRPEAPPASAEPPLPPGTQRATQAEPSEPAAAEPSLDDVANWLYEKLSSRLRNELLIDRERAGLLTDR